MSKKLLIKTANKGQQQFGCIQNQSQSNDHVCPEFCGLLKYANGFWMTCVNKSIVQQAQCINIPSFEYNSLCYVTLIHYYARCPLQTNIVYRWVYGILIMHSLCKMYWWRFSHGNIYTSARADIYRKRRDNFVVNPAAGIPFIRLWIMMITLLKSSQLVYYMNRSGSLCVFIQCAEWRVTGDTYYYGKIIIIIKNNNLMPRASWYALQFCACISLLEERVQPCLKVISFYNC